MCRSVLMERLGWYLGLNGSPALRHVCCALFTTLCAVRCALFTTLCAVHHAVQPQRRQQPTLASCCVALSTASYITLAGPSST
jgi:hypothetical protein